MLFRTRRHPSSPVFINKKLKIPKG